MKDSELRMIETMLKKQDELNSAIMKEFGLDTISREQIDLATLDEIGEFTHELKGDWCWWKKTQAPVDMRKVLGELIDVWHFVLSYQNHFNGGEEMLCSYLNEKEMSSTLLERLRVKTINLPFALSHLVYYKRSIITVLIAISEYLGFTIEQVYECYCDKNKINYQRLESGY